MQRLKSASFLGRFLRGHGVISQQTRTLNPLTNHLPVDDPQDVVSFSLSLCVCVRVLDAYRVDFRCWLREKLVQELQFLTDPVR